MTKHDNRASIPKWMRSWIINQHGTTLMALLDSIGKIHDEDIEVFGEYLADQFFITRLKKHEIPFSIRWTIIIGLWVYNKLPQSLKNKYHSSIK